MQEQVSNVRARIYKPAKSTMQSGHSKLKAWKLEFEPSCTQYTEPLMNWTGSHDTKQQVCLSFTTRELAIAYAVAHKIDYTVLQDNPRTIVPKSYADNFTKPRDM
ncbi:ETC complex I subunit conserved region family protein [Ehrlichia chaffeensis str. Liberty]|uniref:Oxidoreductase n=2 Tax=Ehrlichia chaffeensis (strain ATCC CRL-10679 / Arkansas) TaxID=205920 RepID=Q2GHP7_EHRCR|nr:NADH dehydrogenase ubiquinone Fe-S protein 4 [Ehrlichia chaffeensis]ABD44783.1 putative oxidoreductase [Ehrlichia chaffeensis str. Arkansas]AHX06922.1 ETC complex I subunit conserved region family protein [Ehrlichia chaffeensis str. Liberty]AHX09799.1 ETC complex I subunit conserved region family protein [Ehrlichia chaffeensis str. Wakulla]